MKSPIYQRKMKDLFALTNHFGDVIFGYVSLEVRKCPLFRYVSTSELRNHHEKVESSSPCIFSVNKKRNDNCGVNIFCKEYSLRRVILRLRLKAYLSICTWSSEAVKAQRFCKQRQYLLA